VTPHAKQAAVALMTTHHHLSKARACRIVGLSRSVLYRPKVNWMERDKEVIDALNAIIAKRSRWGFWKCFGNPPLEPRGLEVEFFPKEEVLHEKVKIYG
jgi:putative transposase